MKDSVLSQIKGLEEMSIKELKARYIEVYGSDKGAHNNKRYLIKRIAYRIQENALGGLKQEAKDEISQLIEEINPLEELRKSNVGKDLGGTSCKRNKKLPLPGTIIRKTYKGNSLEVKVLEKGFEYGGKSYKSLSNLAKEISGVHCSGFAFFKL